MVTRKGMDISGDYVVSIDVLYLIVTYVLCILKSWKIGQNRILYCFKNSTSIRNGVLFSDYVEFIPTAVSSN